MLNSHKTVKGYGESEQIIQKSRFIAYVNRVESEEDAIQFIQTIKKKHWDATHNCSAYMIGENDLIQKANDDGEPSGTAGVPILEVIKKKGLKDTVVVVTRYFGGIKLGAGGLIRAYGGAASEGINTTGVVERRLMRVMKSTFDYTLLGKIENELRNSHYSIKEIHYLDKVMIESFAEEDKKSDFIDWMTDLSNGQASIEEGDMLYLEHDL